MATKAGRKSLRDKSRVKKLSVKFSDEEYAALKDSAIRAGLTLSAFVRSLLRGKSIQPAPKVPKANLQIYAALARSAANLNQLAHHLNEGRVKAQAHTVSVEVLREELRRLYGHLVALRRDLVGGKK